MCTNSRRKWVDFCNFFCVSLYKPEAFIGLCDSVRRLMTSWFEALCSNQWRKTSMELGSVLGHVE